MLALITPFLILIPLAWLSCLFCLKGRYDAILYSRLGDLAFPWNEHRIMDQIRSIEYAIICWIAALVYLQNDTPLFIALDLFVILVYCIFGFSFWHNGVYMVTKSQIKGIRGKFLDLWLSLSKDDTAKIQQDGKSRIYTLALSLLVAAAIIVFKICNS